MFYINLSHLVSFLLSNTLKNDSSRFICEMTTLGVSNVKFIKSKFKKVHDHSSRGHRSIFTNHAFSTETPRSQRADSNYISLIDKLLERESEAQNNTGGNHHDSINKKHGKRVSLISAETYPLVSSCCPSHCVYVCPPAAAINPCQAYYSEAYVSRSSCAAY